MLHEYEAFGHGKVDKNDPGRPGCSCGAIICVTDDPEREHRHHVFMREWFGHNPGFGRAGTYQFKFPHW